MSERIPTDGGESMRQNPFVGLSSAGLPTGAASRELGPPKSGMGKETMEKAGAMGTVGKGGMAKAAKKDRGRVDIVREKAGRGGKTVTVVKNFTGIGLPEKEQLAKAMQRACGCGGTVKDGQIEIQGDKREEAARILEAAGFRPVMAGG